MIEGALMPDLRIDKKSQRLIPNQELMIEDITQLFANEPDLINSFVLDNSTEAQENKNNVFIPEFENVYENLESRQRNLNDTARSLTGVDLKFYCMKLGDSSLKILKSKIG